MELESISLEKTFMTPSNMKYLSSILTNCQNLQSVTLEDIVGQENFHNLGYVDVLLDSLKFLTYLPYLKKLNLSRNHLKDVLVKNLLPIIVKLKLEELDLSCNNLSDDGFLYLC